MSAYTDAVVADAPLHYWKLNEPSGTVADDAIGSLNGTYTDMQTGTYLQPKLVLGDDEVGTTFRRNDVFSGTSAGVSIPTDASLENSSFTVEFWYSGNPFSNGINKQVAFSYDNAATSATPTRGLQVWRDEVPAPDAWKVTFYNNAGTPRTAIFAFPGGFTEQSAQEHHVVATHDATAESLKIYVDGVLGGTVTSTTGITPAWPTTNARVWIGRQGTGTTSGATNAPMNCSMGHVAYYNRALTLDEITEHYLLGSSLDDVDDYVEQTWTNSPSTTTPISASRLGHIETGIRDAFEGRRQDAEFVIVASDAPSYMKRGPRTLVCDGTMDNEQFSIALTDLIQRNDYNQSKSALILVSPGLYNFDINPDYTSGTIKRCVWDQITANAIGRGITIHGFGKETVLRLVAGQTDDVRMIEIGSNTSNVTIEGLNFQGEDLVSDPGTRTGLYTNGSYKRIQNITGYGLHRMIHLRQGYESIVTNVHMDGMKVGVYVDECWTCIIENVYGEGYEPDAIGVHVYGSSMYNTISASVEGCELGAVRLEDSATDSPMNNKINVTGFWGNGPGAVLDNAHQNIIRGSLYENYHDGSTFDGSGLVLTGGSSHNDIDMHIVGNARHGIWLDNASHNRVRGIVSANGQETTNTYDNVFVDNNSDSNDISVMSRKSTPQYPTIFSRYGVNIANANCDANRVTNSDLLTAGNTAALNDVGTGTITASGNRT
jgi:hypothetical protein